ncbi:hypothetical protein OK016_09460 [Vibrio chagasii]|nr:hypothetical protein [Vibrio chagasii]
MYASGAGAAQRFSIPSNALIIVAGLAIGTIFYAVCAAVIYSYLAEKHKPLPCMLLKTDLKNLTRVDEAKSSAQLADNK